MASVDLISTLKLLRQFGDSPEVVKIISATLDELERLYQLEAAAAHLATAATVDKIIDPVAAEHILRLVRK